MVIIIILPINITDKNTYNNKTNTLHMYFVTMRVCCVCIVFSYSVCFYVCRCFCVGNFVM